MPMFGAGLARPYNGTPFVSTPVNPIAAPASLPGMPNMPTSGPAPTSSTVLATPIATTAASARNVLPLPANSNAPSVAPMNIAGSLPLPNTNATSLSAPIATSHAETKHGFNDPGGAGDILRSIAATLMSMGGNPAGANALWAAISQRGAAAELQHRVEAQRIADRQEWTWREDYKRTHPDDALTQAMVAAGIDPSSSQAHDLYRQRAENLAAPPLMAVDGFDAQGNPTKTFIPRPTAGSGNGSGPPTPTTTAGPAVGTVRNGFRFVGGNPNDRSSWQPVGGAASTANAPFVR